MKKHFRFMALVLILGWILAGCTEEIVQVTVEVDKEVIPVVTETITKAGEEVEVTRVVTENITEIVEVSPEPEKLPVTLNMSMPSEPPTVDPALVISEISTNLVKNMFVALTESDQVTAESKPLLATDWEVGENEEGDQTWTFYLRDDIQWVKWDPRTERVVQVLDGDDNPTYVKPSEVEYGVKRTIDPTTASNYANILYIIKNAERVNEGDEELTLADVGISCDDEALTCTFTLETPAAFFPSIAGLPISMPTPSDAISDYADNWIEPGLMVSNGRYVMSEWIHGDSITLVKNPYWIEADRVQIELIKMAMIADASTAFAMYENNEVDLSGVPSPDLDRVKADPVLSSELRIAPVACTYFYGFTNTKYPFTDVRVRKAFSQSIDRASLTENVLKGGQIPASSFAPPGIFGAPEPGTVGIFYDVEEAQANLQSFLDDEGLTMEEFNALNITLMYNTSEENTRIAAAIQQMWKDHLGVDVRAENQEWSVYLQTIRKTSPVEDSPHIWRLGWCAAYADENNWVHEVFNSDASMNMLRRNCLDPNCGETTTSEFDDLTQAAMQETDPNRRVELYSEAERILAADEAAYAPIYHFTVVNVTKPWLTRTFPPVVGPAYYEWTIDWEMKKEALGIK
jgi:oligopeptide transport system substrate-binding protein